MTRPSSLVGLCPPPSLSARQSGRDYAAPEAVSKPVSVTYRSLGCLVANGQALAYVYFEGEPGRRAAAKLVTPMRARAIGAEIANLPEPLSAPGT
jgi:hypothetical protein